MIKFGVAGNSHSFFEEGKTSTVEAAPWCAARGIDVFEYSFGRGINLSEETARAIGAEFKKYGVELSVHAPYFINFANPDPEAIRKSVGYVMTSVRKVQQFGGNRVVVHPATQGKASRYEAEAVMLNNIPFLTEALDAAGVKDVKICFETMGKQGQMGTVEEIIKVVSLDPRFYPCIDFGHINAREQGILKTALNYNTILQQFSDFLPEEKVINTHVHFSKIEYGAKGEIRHLTFADDKFGPDFEPLAEVIAARGLAPYIICESDGTQAEDCIYMKSVYNAVMERNIRLV